MRKFLSIIIPRYTETEREIFPLLTSINSQIGIDFNDIEVVIANDGGGAGQLDDNLLNLFNFKTIQVNLETNGGPGVARQAGLDNANGDYVLFCDADDCLHNVGVLGAMIQEVETNAPDILYTSWIEELLVNGKYQYITHDYDNTWMHGKVLRRAFLTSHNIRFHDQLRVHEDSYFLSIVAAVAERSRKLSITSYVWKYVENSITRRDDASYTYNSIPTFIEACLMANRIVEQIAPNQMPYKIAQFVLYNYFCFHQPGWQAPENAHYLKDAEDAFVKHMGYFMHYFREADPKLIAEVYNQERQRNFNGCIEVETIDMWLNRLGL